MATMTEQCPDLLEMAELLKTIGHPLRLRIMSRLADRCCCVRDLWECLQLPQAIVSQHLKILKDRGVVVARREGVKVCYSIKEGVMRDIVRVLMV